jgi:dipeptidyl aminopeptidase/acylaminoacyl peptidase
MTGRNPLRWTPLALALALMGQASFAQTPTTEIPRVTVTGTAPAPLPVKDYVRPPEVSSVVLSPNGKYLAVVMPIRDRRNLAVIDIEARTSKVLTGLTSTDVINPRWVGNDRLLFTMGEANTPTGVINGGGLFMVSRDGKESRTLNQTRKDSRRQISLLATIPGNDKEVLVEGNLRSGDSSDIYRLDITTGRSVLVTETRPERTSGYLLDRNRVPRIAFSSVKDSLESIVWYKETPESPWTEIGRSSDDPRATTLKNGEPILVPLAIDNDDRTLLVATARGRDTYAIARFDPKTRQFGETLASHARYDMGVNALGDNVPGLVRKPVTGEIIGYRVEAEKPQTSWTDESYARLQAMVDRSLPGRVNTFQRSEGRTLIASYSDRVPPEYFLMDEAARKIEMVAASKPWLSEKDLPEQRPFLLKTRDGLEIPSYYFLPTNYQPGQKLPTVVHIHGGPMVRADTFANGYGVFEAQLLASRGYAVIVPNFRITPGFGQKILLAGYGAVGREMSEDHEDAVKWGVAQGFTDPNRVCISGASYGGYATLRALAKTPDLFKCGIAGLSVSDMELQLTSTSGDTAYNVAGQNFWRILLGEDKKPGSAREVSPVHQADRIKAKVFMYAGSDDIRTPIEQTTRMVDALKKAGNAPEVMIKKEEAHGFGKLDNRVDLGEKMLDFLAKHIGTGPTPQ